MITKTSIIFHLDEDLKVYAFDENVNQSFTYLSQENIKNYEVQTETAMLKRITCLNRQKHTLELANRFERVWISLDQQGWLNTQRIYFLLGPKAGFTDTRVIFIWLQTWKMFNRKNLTTQTILSDIDFFALKLVQHINLEEYNYFEIKDIIKQAKPSLKGKLTYTTEPRIGKIK